MVVSIRRADYWLVEAHALNIAIDESQFQSAGRIIGWLKSRKHGIALGIAKRFNPPGGLLVG